MLNRRWWDVVAAAVVAVVAIITLLDPPYGAPDWAALATLGVFLVGYVAYFRWRLGHEDTANHVVITVAMAILLVVGTSLEASFATFQAFAYPFVWVTAPSPRRAVTANIVLAAAVAVGYTLHFGIEGLLAGIGVAALSLAFSLAIGLWITRIAEEGEERARLLAELQAAQGELAAMHRSAGVTEERARLAREIHDTIAQSLTGLVMVAQRAGNRLEPEPAHDAASIAAARGDVALIEEMARGALTDARTLVATLSPVDVQDGLVRALERLASTFERESGVQVVVHADTARGLGRELEVVLLRTAQEGLANVRKHSRATHALVEVTTDASSARLSVRDDGVGPESVAEDRAVPRGGFGLAGIRDRVGLVGGRVAFGSGDGGGSVLQVEVPLRMIAEPASGSGPA